jgi:hypothetical protein
MALRRATDIASAMRLNKSFSDYSLNRARRRRWRNAAPETPRAAGAGEIGARIAQNLYGGLK